MKLKDLVLAQCPEIFISKLYALMKAEETVWNSVLQKFYYRLEHDFNQYLEWELHTGLKNSIPQHNAISYLYLSS